LRFSPADVNRAFDQVGYPAAARSNEKTAEILRSAILWLADKTRRADLAMGLYLRLPDFTAAGRFLDGWIVQACAHATSEYPGESNPFLYHMFRFGYDAWAMEAQRRNESLLHEFGLAPERAHRMTMEEIEAWLAARTADPATRAKLEALFQANPAARAETVANLEALRRDCVLILDRPDASVLFLSPEEVQPWLAVMEDRFAKAHPGPVDPRGEAAPDSEIRQALQDAAMAFSREMAASVFTKERRDQVVAQLRKYRSDRFAAGDKRVASHATAAMNYVEREDEPSLNSFLIGLCHASIKSVIAAAAGDPALKSG